VARRSRDRNEGLARDLRDTEFAREFILAGIEEGIPLPAILAKLVRAYGVREFSKKIRMASPNLLRAISPKHNPTQQTLERLLRPFGLQLSVKKIASASKRHAA
jgi:DNA-binding phage protein